MVEDDAILGVDLKMTLEDAEYSVVGPAMAQAHRNSGSPPRMLDDNHVEGAILDINLGNERSDAIADRLDDAGIPVFFLSGHSASVLQERHQLKQILAKPHADAALFRMLPEHIGGAS
ncbi:response regulator [Citreimonas sp.]|uniref:response regulator n=1 Tax=Citreimonas sp. TaxID=3036715 RepID=UPI0035C82A33